MGLEISAKILMLRSMDKIVLDTNIWVSYVDRKDILHQEATILIEKELEKKSFFVLPNYIDVECITVLNRRATFTDSLRWMEFRETADRIERLTFSDEDHDQICLLFSVLKKHRLSLTDVSLIYLSRLGYGIHTFDAELRKSLNSLR